VGSQAILYLKISEQGGRVEEVEKDWFIQKMRGTSAPFLSVLFYFRDKVVKPELQI